MSKQVIVTPSGPPARGAYSPAVRAREFLFVSGQSVRDRELNAVGETIEEQTEKTIENVTSIIHDAGATLADIVKATVHLSDLGSSRCSSRSGFGRAFRG